MIWRMVSIFLIVYFSVALLIWLIFGISTTQGLPIWAKAIHAGLLTLSASYMVVLFVKYEILGRGPK